MYIYIGLFTYTNTHTHTHTHTRDIASQMHMTMHVSQRPAAEFLQEKS
jgi:hypothetical protein